MTSKSGITVEMAEDGKFDLLIERLKVMIDAGHMDRTSAQSINHAIEDAERRWERASDLNEALNSDDAFDQYIKKYFDPGLPIIRASSYRSVGYLQELDMRLDLNSFHCRDERRPVIMRGAYHFVMNGERAVFKLLTRYLRRKKYTCFDPKDNERVMTELQKAIENKRYGERWLRRKTYFPRDPDLEVHWRDGHCSIWINGKHYSYLDVGRERPVIDPPELPPVMYTAVGSHRSGHQRKAAIVFKALQELGIDV